MLGVGQKGEERSGEGRATPCHRLDLTKRNTDQAGESKPAFFLTVDAARPKVWPLSPQGPPQWGRMGCWAPALSSCLAWGQFPLGLRITDLDHVLSLQSALNPASQMRPLFSNTPLPESRNAWAFSCHVTLVPDSVLTLSQ